MEVKINKLRGARCNQVQWCPGNAGNGIEQAHGWHVQIRQPPLALRLAKGGDGSEDGRRARVLPTQIGATAEPRRKRA